MSSIVKSLDKIFSEGGKKTNKQEALKALEEMRQLICLLPHRIQGSQFGRYEIIRQHIEQPDIDLEGMMMDFYEMTGDPITTQFNKGYLNGYNQALKDVKAKIGGAI